MIDSPNYLINGRSDNHLSPMDRGLSYGDGVFRTFIVSSGVPRNWELQYKKLFEDCSSLGIICPFDDLLLQDISHLFENEVEAIAKIIVTRGQSQRGYALPTVANPNRVLIKYPMPRYPINNFKDGVSLHICDLKLGHQAKLAGIKHLNRLENVLARMEWNNEDYADGLLMDTKGYVIECTMSNIFARYGETLMTPDLSDCGVAGITRQRILDLAKSLGYNPVVRPITLMELMEADEVIICNSLFGVWQVRSIDIRKWSNLLLAPTLRVALGY